MHLVRHRCQTPQAQVFMISRILIADDHPVFREGLCSLVGGAFPDAELLEAGTMDEVLERAGEGAKPDLFVLDLLFPGMNPAQSLPLLRQRYPTSSLVIVSMLDDEATVRRIAGLGIDGYVAKSLPGPSMVDAIQRICNGEFVIARPGPDDSASPAIPQRSALANLTQRQREILALIGEGSSNKAIGRSLGLSPFTVRNHISLLFRVLGVTTRSGLADLARQEGIIPLG